MDVVFVFDIDFAQSICRTCYDDGEDKERDSPLVDPDAGFVPATDRRRRRGRKPALVPATTASSDRDAPSPGARGHAPYG